ncbi:GntR family transcriptional regulator [Streptomyces sp. ACA25]|uniref:GntR family transcriptional regulator n=1 Tax=Streptomyces sp. ACA25 TaxID=3022596 RepID=UPI0023080AF3|nr:GntR family transcriptional regulator [Streptomyces sp. ACA25]MDB1086019.1 GntR family transcriptional regulator [Streptomyces sp. ACA25]
MIRRTTLREQLADALREEILAGRLEPNEELTVREIAEQYGVSATPVREALLDLSAQGLLVVAQHRGFRIRRFSLTDFRHMVEARTLVGEGVLRRGPGLELPGGAPQAFTSIRRRAGIARQAARAGELDILIGYDLRFWRELTALLGNPYIGDFLDRLRIQCWAFAVPRLRREADLRGRLWHGYLELTDAVERQDAADAGQLLSGLRVHALQLATELVDGEPENP